MSKFVEVLKTAIALSMQEAQVDYVYKILDELDECKVKVWREDETVKLPTYAKDGDACMDVYVHSIEYKDDGRVVYHTGLHFALPEDYEMEIRPRSSNTKTLAVMQNGPGTLDGGYRGELMIVHRDLKDVENPYAYYNVGDRCGQILVRHRERIVWDEVSTEDELGETDRGQGGFGSTNK
jgi:dUTP pyrophosphatase